MSVLLKLDNYGEPNKLEKTYLNADSAVGAVTVVLKSAQNVFANYWLLIGNPAGENTELRRILSVTGADIGVDALVREHSRYDDVTVLAANKIQVYRANNTDGNPPADAAYAALGSPIDIDYDQLNTRFTDVDGGAGHWYKYTYVNSHNGAESELSESEAVRGGSLADYASIRDIREEAGIQNNPYLSDTYVAGQRTRAQSVINSALKGNFTIPFAAPVPGIIERATILLAAGYILKREFGSGATNTNADGQAKIDEVMSMSDDKPGLIKQILDGTLTVVDEETGNATGSGGTRISGWPNAQTASTPTSEGGSVRKFRAGMKF
jgi:hypothetical protein